MWEYVTPPNLKRKRFSLKNLTSRSSQPRLKSPLAAEAPSRLSPTSQSHIIGLSPTSASHIIGISPTSASHTNDKDTRNRSPTSPSNKSKNANKETKSTRQTLSVPDTHDIDALETSDINSEEEDLSMEFGFDPISSELNPSLIELAVTSVSSPSKSTILTKRMFRKHQSGDTTPAFRGWNTTPSPTRSPPLSPLPLSSLSPSLRMEVEEASSNLIKSQQRFISETDLTNTFTLNQQQEPETKVKITDSPCSLCGMEDYGGRCQWTCMKYCNCTFHSPCLQMWRMDAHTLCPNCSSPISHNLFHAKYLGKVLTANDIKKNDCEESLAAILEAKDQVLKKNSSLVVRIKVNATHLRFETVSNDDNIALRFKRSIADVLRIDRVDGFRAAITFTPDAERSDEPDNLVFTFGEPIPEIEKGYIIQVFSLPTVVEMECMCDAIALQLSRSQRFSGSFSDLTRLNIDDEVTTRLQFAKDISSNPDFSYGRAATDSPLLRRKSQPNNNLSTSSFLSQSLTNLTLLELGHQQSSPQLPRKNLNT